MSLTLIHSFCWKQSASSKLKAPRNEQSKGREGRERSEKKWSFPDKHLSHSLSVFGSMRDRERTNMFIPSEGRGLLDSTMDESFQNSPLPHPFTTFVRTYYFFHSSSLLSLLLITNQCNYHMRRKEKRRKKKEEDSSGECLNR